MIKIADLEIELNNEKIKNDVLEKDLLIINSEKKDFLSQIESLKKELNKNGNEIINTTNEKNDKNNDNNNDNDNNENPDKKEEIELLKNTNVNLIAEINKLKENEAFLNLELDDYEREAKESEKEVNMLKEINNQLLYELKKIQKYNNDLIFKKKNYSNNNINNNIIKKSKNDNNVMFIKIFKSFIDKLMLKYKIKFFLNLMIIQSNENLLIENNKLNNEKRELIQRVNILTEILNNPQNIGKYFDENGNLNYDNIQEQEYENDEDINYVNENNNNNIIEEKYVNENDLIMEEGGEDICQYTNENENNNEKEEEEEEGYDDNKQE